MIGTQRLVSLGSGRVLKSSDGWRVATSASTIALRLRALTPKCSRKELVELRPDVILSNASPATAALQRETSVIPIVFTGVADPIGSGFVAGLARPGGNITGFMLFEPSITGKWLAMLKEVTPDLARAALMINPKSAPYYQIFLRAAQAAAPSLGIEVIFVPFENTAPEIERAIEVCWDAQRRPAPAPG